MPTTIKLVVIGSSGVGKTSIRGKYLSGRFSNGYRATIGADFITKTLPHPTDPSQSIILQIWDTAGQERFSSLSTAFFRGADAALLMFDVNTPDSMLALKKWWNEFRDRAPVADEDINDYCCVVVGNKIDAIHNGKGRGLVSKPDALAFLDELVPPPPSISICPPLVEYHPTSEFFTSSTSHESSSPASSLTAGVTRSDSVEIHHPDRTSHPPPSPNRKLTQSRSHSSPQFYSGTMATTRSTFTIYHTPSSSLYHSARSSPEPSSLSASPTSSFRLHKHNTRSSGSMSSGSAPTITPSLYARDHGSSANTNTSDNLLSRISSSSSSSPSHSPAFSPPLLPLLQTPLEQGPKLFFTSAKTGEGVAEVFEYIAYRVNRKWEFEAQIEARRMSYREASAAEAIRLGLSNGDGDLVASNGRGRWSHGCCSS